MNKYFTFTLALVCQYLVGCGNTVEGLADDARNNTQAAEQRAQSAGKQAAGMASEAGKVIAKGTNELSKTAENAGSAAKLTPTIKSAIIADSMLNDPANMIDVDADSKTVTLSGHVKDQTSKDRAGEIAKRILKDTKSTNSLKNNLKVKI